MAQQPRPVLIYDGDCTFCRSWVARWRRRTGDAVEYLAAQAGQERFPQLVDAARREAVRLVEPDGSVRVGADAVAATLAHAPRPPWWLLAYRYVPGVAAIARGVYRVIARHRGAAAVVTRALWGALPRAPTFVIAGWLFTRLIASIYLVAFTSLLVQVDGLIGEHGLQPVGEFFARVRERLGAQAVLRLPSLLWLHPTGATAHALCWAGVGLALAAIVGIAQGWCLLALWALYLSLTTACGPFLSFQWDVLLLESGALTLLLASWRLRAPLAMARQRPIARALVLLLLARLMIASGLVKLASGDETWRDCTALIYHFETQPLPTTLGWWLHHAPGWLLRGSCVAMYAIELGAPLAMCGPRRLRLVACASLVALQVVIAATGNYGFFNLLSAALCLPLIEDESWPRWLRHRAAAGISAAFAPRSRLRTAIALPLAAMAAAIACAITIDRIALHRAFSPEWRSCRMLDTACRPLLAVGEQLAPLHSINAYGLFEVMTRPRYEIELEGSADGTTWRPYVFRWKPDDIDAPPRWSEPHMPRLDWSMWFAALHTRVADAWFVTLAQRLLEGEASVRALLRDDPFAHSAPPQAVRATRWRYRFATIDEHRASGAWWVRDEPQPYLPAIRLR